MKRSCKTCKHELDSVKICSGCGSDYKKWTPYGDLEPEYLIPHYQIDVFYSQDPEGYTLVVAKDNTSCISEGDTFSEAIHNLAEAVRATEDQAGKRFFAVKNSDHE